MQRGSAFGVCAFLLRGWMEAVLTPFCYSYSSSLLASHFRCLDPEASTEIFFAFKLCRKAVKSSETFAAQRSLAVETARGQVCVRLGRRNGERKRKGV